MRATMAADKLVVLVILALTLALCGCGGGSGGGGVITIAGRIVDDGTLAGLQGVRVVGSGNTETTTDADGIFSLSNQPASLPRLTAAFAGYDNLTIPVPAGAGDVSVGLVYLKPASRAGYGHVTGTVSEAGLAAPGAILQCGGRQAQSKQGGTFTIYNVPVGFQTVMARSSGGLTAGSSTVTVANQSTVSTVISLSTQPPPPPPI